MSSSPSSSSPSRTSSSGQYSSFSSSQRRRKHNTGPQSRNRGANAANRNRRGHSFRLDNKNNDGNNNHRTRRKSNTKRAPRWEREGDNLYAEVTKRLSALGRSNSANDDDDDENTNINASEQLIALANERIGNVQDVCRLLEPWTFTKEEQQQLSSLQKHGRNTNAHHPPRESTDQSKEEEEDATTSSSPNKKKKSPPFLWGSLPVGPVLASRLNASERSAPTSVQRAAFPILTATQGKGSGSRRSAKKQQRLPKRTNAIIASPTGTGKTLAYLLPLLCTSPGGQTGEGTGGVLIVTPTIELAVQIQREVDVLWPRQRQPLEEEEDSFGRSSLFVVGADELDNESNNNLQDGGATGMDGEEEEDTNNNSQEEEIPPGRRTLQSIGHAPLIAGTPKMLRMLYREAERIANDPTYYNGILAPAVSKEERIASAALLSNLRAIVLDEADRLLRTEAAAREATERKQRKIARRKAEEAAAAAMEEYLPPPPPAKKRRLIIARQTQTELLLRDLPVPDLDDVQIVCASATIGRTMRRQLMQILDAPSADAAAMLVTGDEDERVKSKDVERRRGALLPDRLRHAYRVVVGDDINKEEEDQEEEGSAANAESEGSTMSTAVRNEERRTKATINTLWDIMVSMEEAKPILIFPGRVGVERVQRELLARGLEDVRTLRNLDGTSPEPMSVDVDASVSESTDAKDWKSTSAYIIGERFARGLDLPDVEYVVMLAPPSSAAGYTHMAGRTGRNGRAGTAITLVRAKNNEVQRLAAIAEALGLRFDKSLSGISGGGGEVVDVDPIHVSSDASSVETTVEAPLEEPEEDEQRNSEDKNSVESYPWELLSESALKRKKNAELYEYLVTFGHKVNKSSKKAELVSAIQSLHGLK